MNSVLHIMYNQDIKELDGLKKELIKDINYMHRDHRGGRGSVLSSQLKDNILNALDTTIQDMQSQLQIKYKITK